MEHKRKLESCPPGTIFYFGAWATERWQVLKPGVNLDGFISEGKTLIRMIDVPVVDFIDSQTFVEVVDLPNTEPEFKVGHLLSKEQAEERWGAEMLGAVKRSGSVLKAWSIIRDHDGDWEPIFDDWFEIKGYRKQETED